MLNKQANKNENVRKHELYEYKIYVYIIYIDCLLWLLLIKSKCIASDTEPYNISYENTKRANQSQTHIKEREIEIERARTHEWMKNDAYYYMDSKRLNKSNTYAHRSNVEAYINIQYIRLLLGFAKFSLLT